MGCNVAVTWVCATSQSACARMVPVSYHMHMQHTTPCIWTAQHTGKEHIVIRAVVADTLHKLRHEVVDLRVAGVLLQHVDGPLTDRRVTKSARQHQERFVHCDAGPVLEHPYSCLRFLNPDHLSAMSLSTLTCSCWQGSAFHDT